MATLWTLDQAKKESEYFSEYVGFKLKGIKLKKGDFVAKKAKDGVYDIIVNVKKFNRGVFDEAMKILKPYQRMVADPIFAEKQGVVEQVGDKGRGVIYRLK